MMRRNFFFILAAGFTAARLDALAPRSPIGFESDSLEYGQANQVITAAGHVTVHQGSYTFQSDNAQFDIPGKTLEAWGHVRFRDILGNEINSESIRYNAETGSARLTDATGTFQEWLFSAKNAERDDKGNFILERARLTTCERDLSKYHLYGYRVKLMPGKRLTVQHAVFKLGPVPVLYFPYYYYPLGEKHLAFQFFPGQNQSEGAFVRTVLGYALTEETYLKAYVDYLSLRGTGTGGEFDYYFGDKAKGSLYGYRIEDRISNQERWNVRLAHWQKLSETAIFQTNANQLSDDAFPNDFFREDFNRVVRDFTSSAALTFQKRNNYFRVIGSRTELFDLPSRKFYADDALGPRLEWTQTQSSLGFLGLEKTMSAGFTEHYAGRSYFGEPLSRDFRRESDEAVTVLRKFKIVPVWSTFVPKLTLANVWTDRPQASEQVNFTQRLTEQSTLRQRVGYNWTLDMTHTFVQRLQNNTADDLGREAHTLNILSVVNFWRDMASFRFDTAHNLPKARGEALAPLERRNYSPLNGEFIINPRDNVDIFFREQYLLSDPNTGSAHALNTESEVTFGRKMFGEDYYSFGTSYFSTRDDAFEIRQAFRWSPTRTLKFEGRLTALVNYRKGSVFNPVKGELSEKEVQVKKEWRCWVMSLVLRQRPGVTEFLFNLELKLDQGKRERNEERAKSSEFYPWRGDSGQ